MGLLKNGCVASLLALTCVSCTTHNQAAMSAKDEDLLNRTLKSSTLAFSSNERFSNLDAQLQMQVPKNLQYALSFYKEPI